MFLRFYLQACGSHDTASRKVVYYLRFCTNSITLFSGSMPTNPSKTYNRCQWGQKQFGQHFHFSALVLTLDVHRCTHLSVLHSDNSRHGGNFKLLSNLLMLIDIDGYQIHHFAPYHLRLRSDFFESGGEKFAWLTPDCEEIYQYWCVCVCA